MKKIVCFALCVSAAMMMASCVEEKDGQVSAAGELVEITLGVAGKYLFIRWEASITPFKISCVFAASS